MVEQSSSAQNNVATETRFGRQRGLCTSNLTHNSYHLHRMRGSCVETSSGNSNSSCSRRRFRFVTVSFLVYDDDEAIGSANAHTKCTMMIQMELELTSRRSKYDVNDDDNDGILERSGRSR